MSRVGVITWDWREQPSTRDLKALIEALTDGAVTVVAPNTGGDQYVLVLSRGALDEWQATQAYEAWRRDEEYPVTFAWPPVAGSGETPTGGARRDG